MINRVNDSMAICHATVTPPTTVQQYLQSITKHTTCQQVSQPTDATNSHPQALKTVRMSIPREYLLAD